jgi:D-alanine-D-alanine ligase
MFIGRRIGVLMGGLSSERELSLKTGEAVHAALTDRGHQAIKVFVDRDLDLVLRAERIDIAFLALHGRYGEDGCVQGLLELLGIPYTGSSVLASALAMDKLKAKELFRLHNLPTPQYYVHRRGQGGASEQHGSFGYPAIVKPRAEGSSLGVRRVEDDDDLDAAVDEALRFDDDVLVERFVEGVELHVALLGDRALGAIEIAHDPAADGGIFDVQARHGRGKAKGRSHVTFHAPPRLSVERLRGALTFAERAARALECSGLVEVDIVVSERGNEHVLEVDTLPSLAPQSLLPKILHAADIEFGALVETVLFDAKVHAGGRANASRTRAAHELTPDRRLAPEHH